MAYIDQNNGLPVDFVFMDKIERLKTGLMTDTMRISSSLYPSFKASQRSYGLKSGKVDAFDPLRRRSKMFRQSVVKFAPPYYFWLKEFIKSRKLKPVVPADHLIEEVTQPDANGDVLCEWCHKSVPFVNKEKHKTTICKKRHEFIQRGYFECSSCKIGFIDETKARNHVIMHFPKRKFEDDLGQNLIEDRPKQYPIICRDQAKRKKWL